ncbi:MAG: S-layer homology domain-containing protein [Agathobaculum sp.]|jgi:uncharacterized repeat protein (TIGR02543 family)|uniref:S-layer homology domain-containing protein n=1 Tax=Agathobaculum sp. TaxID=2048138 RepID=UPI003D8A2231
MSRKNRFVSILLALCMCIGMLPMTALAADGQPVTSWDALKTAITDGQETEVTVTVSGTLEKKAADQPIEIPAGKTVTLIGETGAKIIRPDKSTVGEFVVPSGAELTLSGDITVAGAETNSNPGNLSQANFVKVAEGGKLHLKGALTAATYAINPKCGHNSFILCEGETTIEEGAALSGWLCNDSQGEFKSECAALVVKGANASLTMTGGEVSGNENRATSGSASGAAVQIRDGAAFIMQGGSIQDNTAGKQGCGGGVMIAGGGCRFEMTGGDITGNIAQYGAGVYLEGKAAGTQTEKVPATFTMTGGSISQNVLNNSGGSYGGGLYAQDAEVQIVKLDGAAAGPEFSRNTTSIFPGEMWSPFTADGGAIYCTDSTVEMNGADVSNHQMESTNAHGGVVHLNNTNATLTNTSMTNNQCGNVNMAYAGAFYIVGASDVTMNNMTITGNSAAPESQDTNGGAGAICVSGSKAAHAKLEITDSVISNNLTGGAYAGAIYSEYAELSIANTEINGNTVRIPDSETPKDWFIYSGGALYLAGSTVTLERVTLSDNQCVDGYGGAIMMEDITDRNGTVLEPCNVTLTDCTLMNNKAEDVNSIVNGSQGGAIYVGSGTLTLQGNTTITGNVATAGGAIVNEGTLNMQGGTITGNTATGTDATKDEGIGGGVANLGTFTMTGGALHSNTAARGGNDFYNYAEKPAGGDVDININDKWEGNHGMELESLLPVSRAAAAHGTFTLLDAKSFGFDGWYEDAPDARYADGTTTSYTVTPNDTSEKYLTVGKPLAVKVKVTFEPGEHGTLSNPTSFELTKGEKLTAISSVTAQSGWQFVNWKDAAGKEYTSKEILALPISDNMTFTAQYKTVSSGGGGGSSSRYTLTYQSNGGTEYKSERYDRNTVVKLDKLPTREGYTFTGWYADKELSRRITEIKMTSNKTVYAGWQVTGVPDWLNGDDHFAYVVGYSDGTVRPQNNISRAEVATIFFRLLKEDIREENLTSANVFADVNEEMWCNTAISTMAKLGVVKGRTAERFDPNAPITRAEFAAICARFDTSKRDGDSNFTDIAGHWAEDEIERAASLGWIKGYTDGTFRPENYITRAEAMTMINRVLNRLPEDVDDLLDGMNVWPDNQPDTWYYLAVQEATNSHDFTRKGDVHEHWTKLTENPDWRRYETTTSGQQSRALSMV